MGSLFEPTAVSDIMLRLQKLQPGTKARWGKMNVAQMLAHCGTALEDYFGERKRRRSVSGLLFGKIAKRRLFSEKPWPQGLPTAREYRIKAPVEFDRQRDRLVRAINRFSTEGIYITQNVHPFFGRLSSQEWALLGYRHLDHHFRQFGV